MTSFSKSITVQNWLREYEQISNELAIPALCDQKIQSNPYIIE
jgi:hypothetical protein